MGKTNYYSHQIRSLAKGCSLSITWCPAHVGIEGIELADLLARGAAKKTASNIDRFTSHSFLKRKTREYILNAWHNDWQTEV